jgi:hypothetical protein
MLKVRFDRHSVNMGDDGEDHAMYKVFRSSVTLGRVLDHVFRTGYLPLVGRDRWDVWVGDAPRRALAILHTEHGRPRPTSVELAQPDLLRQRLDGLADRGPDGTIQLFFDRPSEGAPPPRLG